MKKIIFLIIYTCLASFFLQAEIIVNMSPGRLVEFDALGNIYSDWGEHSIAKYSPSGELLLKMGVRGEGPGDIKRLGWFALNPVDNIIYVTEFVGGNKWVSKFSTEGKYLGEWSIGIDLRSTTYDGLSLIEIDSKGNVYIQTYKSDSRRYKDMTVGMTKNSIIQFSPRGEKIRDIYHYKADFYADKPGKGNITIPFGNYLEWTLWGDKIIVREHNHDFISMFSFEGKLESKINLPFKREKVTGKDIDEWEKMMKSFPSVRQAIAQGVIDMKYWRKNLPFPEYKPVSGAQLFVDSHGNLYSKKYTADNLDENIWAKINLQSKEITIVKFKVGYRLKGIRENFFFFSTLNDEDNRITIKIDEKELFNEK